MPHCLPLCWFLTILGWNQRRVKRGASSQDPSYRPHRGAGSPNEAKNDGVLQRLRESSQQARTQEDASHQALRTQAEVASGWQ